MRTFMSFKFAPTRYYKKVQFFLAYFSILVYIYCIIHMAVPGIAINGIKRHDEFICVISA